MNFQLFGAAMKYESFDYLEVATEPVKEGEFEFMINDNAAFLDLAQIRRLRDFLQGILDREDINGR